jgi:putative glycosyltransferase (TIGR04348 family)
MDIIIITPARSSSRSGNDTTSRRWAKILSSLGHSVRVSHHYDGAAADLMIALHAWRSADGIRAFRALYPDRPLIVALSGTDIYDYLRRDPGPTLHSLACADRLLALQGLAENRVPPQHRWKVRVVHQSAPALRSLSLGERQHFDVAVIGHLRKVKDPFRAAKASRKLPPSSRVRIVHLGAADSIRSAAIARGLMRINRRYVWRGERSRGDVRSLLARARAVVLPSLSEGGANVLSEAAAAGIPVLASRIEGSVGLLGRDYPGYFSVGDTDGLARLLIRAETDPKFLKRLRHAIACRAYLFRPEREKAAWKKLIAEILPAAKPPRPQRGTSALAYEIVEEDSTGFSGR